MHAHGRDASSCRHEAAQSAALVLKGAAWLCARSEYECMHEVTGAAVQVCVRGSCSGW